jgi:microcystin-dependent protein
MADELAPLSPTERDMFSRASTAPMDVIQGEVKAYIDRMIEFRVKNTNWSLPVGSPLLIMKDLTAQTGEYVYTDEQGIGYLYCNGAAVSQTTYAGLYAHVGANAFAADSGGNFTLPDARGRSLFFCGTNANADLGDSDGATEANRQAKHAHTNGVTFTPSNGSLSVTAGTLAINPSSHTHTEVYGSAIIAAAGSDVYGGQGSQNTGSTALSITGSPALSGTVGGSVGGTIGTGTAGDAPGHVFIGSLLVRF